MHASLTIKRTDTHRQVNKVAHTARRGKPRTKVSGVVHVNNLDLANHQTAVSRRRHMLPNVAALSLNRINEEGMLWENLPEELKQAVAEQVFKTGNPDCMKPRILGKLFVAHSEKLLIYAYRSKRVQSLTARRLHWPRLTRLGPRCTC